MNRPSLVSAAASLALAASAFAQCNVHRYNVPDFDQKRFGVDNTGNMYCVPTSSLNWMAYIANHGDTSLMGGSSGNWASSSVYNRVTARLNEMGNESDTSGTGGTNLSDAVEGIADYMDSHGVNGYYIICGYKADDDWAPSPKSFYNHMKAGYLVNLCFGRYDLNGGEWERDGGHCMTVVKVDNACGTNPVVGFHNPSNDSSRSTQAPFEMGTWTVEKKFDTYDGDFRGQWQPINSSGTTNRKFIDKFISIKPIFGVTLPTVDVNGITIHRVNPLNTDQLPPTETFFTPGNAQVVTAFPSDRDPGVFVLTRSVGFSPARIYFYDLVEGTWDRLHNFTSDPEGATLDRFGNLYVHFANTIQKFAVGDGSVRLLQTDPIPYIMDSMTYDDSSDTLEVLCGDRGRILTYSRGNLALPPLDRPLPTAVVLTGTPHIAYDPLTRRIFVASSASPSIWGLDAAATTALWTVASTLPVPTGFSGLISLNFTDKGIIAINSRSNYGEFTRSATTAQLIPLANPFFRGRSFSGFFNMARSRSDFDLATDPLNKWRNLETPVVDDNPQPVCTADFNVDGIVDFFDYLDFVDAFSEQSFETDINADYTIDFFDYLDFVDAFANGC